MKKNTFLIIWARKKNIVFKLRSDLQIGKLDEPLPLNVSGYTKVHMKGYFKI